MNLLEIAQQYATPEEFKEKNLPKYLLAKRKFLLPLAFPKVEVEKPTIGIYYLYKDHKVLFIGYSETDCYKALQEDIKAMPDINGYKIYSLSSVSDIKLLHLYLSYYYRPRYNTNLETTNLSFTIPRISKILGKPIKGKLNGTSPDL